MIGWRPIWVVKVSLTFGIWDLGQVDPVALPDVLHLQLEELGVGEHVAAGAEDALFRLVLNDAVQAAGDLVETGIGEHGSLPP
jgi:hypothetical protein